MPQKLLYETKLFFILILASILTIFLDNSSFLNFPKGLVEDVTIPVQYGLYKSSQVFLKQFEFIILARRSVESQRAMEQQMAQILSENATLREELSVAQGFLAQQQALDPQTFTTVAARPVSLSRYLKIDKGLSNGIKVGMPVVYKDNLLGQIKNVDESSSEVILPTDPDSKISAFSQDQSGKAKGVLEGQFGSDILFSQILHDEPIKVGDLVYSEGTESNLPRGLVLGEVSQVMNDPNQVFKQATVKNLFDPTDLDVVFVITN